MMPMIFIGGEGKGKRQKAKGKRQKAKGERRKAKGERRKADACFFAEVFYIDGAMKRTVIRGTNFS
jgi:hypothetical protein